MSKVFSLFTGTHTLIEGEARGADSMARDIALARGWEVIRVPADWVKYGRGAGPIRNQQMLDMGPDQVWAFHDNLACSKGTLDMVRRSKRAGKDVKYFFTPKVHNLHNLPDIWKKMPSLYAYIGRAGHGMEGKYGNPVIAGRLCPNCGEKHTTGGSTLKCYEEMLLRSIDYQPDYIEPLRGKHLVCFCAPNPCHGDVLLRLLS